MGFFPGRQIATPVRRKKKSGGGGGSSAPTPLKTSPGLTREENERRMAINRSRGVGDTQGRSPSDPRHGKATAPSSQFREGSGGAARLNVVEKEPVTRSQMIESLARRQQISRTARDFASSTAQMVSSSPARARRKERETRIRNLQEKQKLSARIRGAPLTDEARASAQARITELDQPRGPAASPGLITVDPVRGRPVSNLGFVTERREGVQEVKPLQTLPTTTDKVIGGLRAGTRPVAETLVMPFEFGGRVAGKGLSFVGSQLERVPGFGPRAEGVSFPGKTLSEQFKQAGQTAEGVGEGFRLEARERPLQTLALLGVSAAVPPLAGAGKFALARFGTPTVIKVAKGAGTVVKFGLIGAFGGVKAFELSQARTPRETGVVLGRTGTQVLAIAAGTRVGIKAAAPLELRAGLEREISSLPKKQQARIRGLLKEASSVKPGKVKELSLSGFERIPKKARPVILKFLRGRDDLIVFGSAAQRTQLSVRGRSFAESDIDVSVLGPRTAPKSAARDLAARLTGAGVKRVSTVGAKVTIKGVKVAEFKPFSKLEASLRQVISPLKPLSSAFVKTPSGITVTRVAPQIQRKVVGGLLPGQRPTREQQLKDIKDLNKLLAAGRARADVEAQESLFFQRTRLKELRLFTGRKAQARLGFTREDPEVLPLTVLRRGRVRLTRSVRVRLVEPPSLARVPRARPSRVVVPPVTPSSLVFTPPQGRVSSVLPLLPSARSSFLPSPVGSSRLPSPVSPPSLLPGPSPVSPLPSPPPSSPLPPALPPVSSRLSPPALGGGFTPSRLPPVTLVFRRPARVSRGRRKGSLFRTFKVQPSLSGVVRGVKAKRKRRPDEFFTGLRERPIPIG